MSITEWAEGSENISEDRMIDRSGDIDQRPFEERPSSAEANIVPFSGAAAVRASHPGQFRVSRPSLYEAATTGKSSSSANANIQSSPVLSEVTGRAQKQLNTQYAKAKSELDSLLRRIQAQEKRCTPPKLDDEFQQIRFQRQKVLISNGPVLSDHIRDERSLLNDLELFKAANGLTREAHYPSSPIFSVGILLMLIVIEAGINGVLFADGSDQGLIGGWMEAFVLSLTNVGVAFLLGRLILPQLHRRLVFSRCVGLLASLLGICMIVSVNLFGAHYRDFRAEAANASVSSEKIHLTIPKTVPLSPPRSASAKKAAERSVKTVIMDASAEISAPVKEQDLTMQKNRPGSSEREAMRRVLDAPADLQSFTSFFLFIIGLCGATIAAWDGYKLDDPFPGYGGRHRRYLEARVRKTEAIRRILNQSNAIVSGIAQTIARKIEDYGQEVTALRHLHHSYAGELGALRGSLDAAVKEAEEEISCHQRLIQKLPSVAEDYYAVSIKQLPNLNEKHIKFHEIAEKKLKSIQKIAQKEQNDVLSMFDVAAQDFQRLLSEASQATLHPIL